MSVSARATAAVAPPAEMAGTRCQACGSPLRQRSDASHRLFFAVIAEAFKQWPETASFQPEDAEHLRAYLLCKAKHCDTLDVRCRNPDAISLQTQLYAIVKATSGKPPLMGAYHWGVRIWWPRSIAYAKCDRKTFNAVSDKVYEIIETVLQTDIQTLKREACRDAA